VDIIVAQGHGIVTVSADLTSFVHSYSFFILCLLIKHQFPTARRHLKLVLIHLIIIIIH